MERRPREPQASRTIRRFRPHIATGPAAHRRRHARAARRPRAGLGARARTQRARPLARTGSRCGSATRRRSRRRAASRSSCPPTASSTTPPRCSTASTGSCSAAVPDLDPAVYGARAPPRARARRRPRQRRVRAGAARRRRGARPARCSASAAACRRSTWRAAARCFQHLPDRTELGHRQAHAPFEPAHAVSVAARLAAAAADRRDRARGQLLPPPGDRPARRRSARLRHRAGRDGRGGLGPRRPLLPRRPVAPRGAHAPARAGAAASRAWSPPPAAPRRRCAIAALILAPNRRAFTR